MDKRMTRIAPMLLPFLLAAGGAAVAAPATHNIVFRGAAQSTVELASDRVAARDAKGNPIFRARADYLFKYAGNPSRRVQEWNPELRLIRVSIAPATPAWLRCADVKSMPIACSDLRLRALEDGNIELGAPVGRVRSAAARGPDSEGMNAIPACPGDPRCPKM